MRISRHRPNKEETLGVDKKASFITKERRRRLWDREAIKHAWCPACVSLVLCVLSFLFGLRVT